MAEYVIYVRLHETGVKEGNAFATFYDPTKDQMIEINVSNQAEQMELNVSANEIIKKLNDYAGRRSNFKLVCNNERYALKKLDHILEN